MSKINNKDITSTSIGATSTNRIGKRNSGAETSVTSSPKDQLKAIKQQIKELNTAIKGLQRQESKLQKQISKSKSTKA